MFCFDPSNNTEEGVEGSGEEEEQGVLLVLEGELIILFDEIENGQEKTLYPIVFEKPFIQNIILLKKQRLPINLKLYITPNAHF